MTIEERIAVLKTHRRDMAACSTFEAFKAQQLAFIEFLIEEMEADLNQNEVIMRWITRGSGQ